MVIIKVTVSLLKTSDSHVKVLTQIEWKDVKLPNKWLLKNVTESIPVQNTLEEDLDYIDQRPDGDLIIWRDPAEWGDGKAWDRVICDEEPDWVWELDEDSFDFDCDFKLLDAVSFCA